MVYVGKFFVFVGRDIMGVLIYLFVQIEVFVCIVEYGSIMKVVVYFGKDCLIVSELLEFFEIELGFVLFVCGGWLLLLMLEGECL